EDVASHAVVALSQLITEATVDELLSRLGSDERLSAGIVKAIQCSKVRPAQRVVAMLATSARETQAWLLYLLALLGREAAGSAVEQLAPALLPQLDFF